jgi:membrane-associated phospholipid phosphatase
LAGIDRFALVWRNRRLVWLPTCLTGIVLAAALPSSAFSLGLWSVLVTLAVSGIAILSASFLASKERLIFRKLGFMFDAVAQGIMITAIIVPLTYIAASYSFPLQDRIFYSADRFVGFDHRAVFDLVNSHVGLANLLCLGYGMIAWPGLGVPIILSLSGRFVRLQQYMLAFSLSLIATAIASIFFPAMGTYQYLGLSLEHYPNIYAPSYQAHINDLTFARSGTHRTLDLLNLRGIIMFPSFHAASAILYFWALRPVRFFGPLALVCNTLMLISTPIFGGHYFVDVVAGVAVAAASIAVAKRLLAVPSSSEEKAPVAEDSRPRATRIWRRSADRRLSWSRCQD